ncbi:MAG: hypothetical protein AAGL23_11220 [Pseudomonadota bacterium]
MDFDDFASLHPKLYRLGVIGASEGIKKHGLLTAKDIATKAGVVLPKGPRKEALPVTLDDGTRMVITDNKPLLFACLAPALDDGLTPEQWLDMLNSRVFFWPSQKIGSNNLRFRNANLGYESEWQVYDTKSLLRPIWEMAEIAPFNTGAASRKAARRGLSTFASLNELDPSKWRSARKSRGLIKGLDKIKEVTVRGSIAHAGDALMSIEPARIL